MGEADSYYRNEAERYFQEAFQKQSEGHLDDAISLYKKSLELFETAEAYTFLGWAYSFRGAYDDAIEFCRKAIHVDPDFGNPYNDIGAYLIEKGKYDDAIDWLQKATVAKRYDSYFYPYYNLGRVWEHKGEWDKALHNYQKALELNSHYSLAAKAIARLQGMMN